jgi:hypothetical protein
VNRRLVGVGLVLGVALGLATACSGSSGGSAESVAAAPYEAEDAGDAGESKSTGQGDGQGEKSGGADNREISQPGVDRTLVRIATIDLAAGDVGETVNRARDIVATAGGYAGQEEVREESATLTLRVPSDRFDRALDELSELGKVISRDQSVEDVTEKVVDLDSRIATQRASVDRVRALLARASTVDEIVRIEQEVTTRESDLESLEQRRQALAGQVAMSTVTIRIGKTSAPAPRQEESSGFLAGLSDGWGAFLDAGAVTLRVIGAVLPFLLVLAVPAVLVIRWWRRRRTMVTAAPAAQQP